MTKTKIRTFRLSLAFLALSGVLVVPLSRTFAVECPVSPTDNQLNRTCDPATSATPDPDLIATYNAQIAEKQKQIEDLNGQSAAYRQQIDTTQGQITSVKTELASIDNQITLANLDIQSKQAQIDSLELEIRSLQLSIDQKNLDVEAKRTILASAIRELDASSRTTTLALVMQTGSFNDFYGQAQAQAEISASLKNTIDGIQKSRQELQGKQSELNTVKDQVAVEQLQLQDQKQGIVEQKNYKASILADTKRSAQQYELLLDGSLSQVDDVQAEITQLHAALQAKLNASSGIASDLPSPSGFIWPTSGRVLNATFMDPEYGLNSGRHYGIDIDADMGTYVRVTADGVVSRIDPPTFGIYPSVVKIQHGGSFDTIYIHLHDIFVAKGQELKQGDIIGKSGGACYTAGAGKCGWFTTGAHLHYEMHLNNVPVNPLTYLP